eukprot:c12261_g1_i1 orf=200-1246(+)
MAGSVKQSGQQSRYRVHETKNKQDSRFYGLPPLKRFKILEKERRQQDFRLCCLPAKKRVCALRTFTIGEGGDGVISGFECGTVGDGVGNRARVVAGEELLEGKAFREAGVSDNRLVVAHHSVCCGDVKGEHCMQGTPQDPAIMDGIEDAEDGVFCDVCKGTDADSVDPIVFCDGCDVMVHASCYGSPLCKGIPSGDWFCSRCVSGDHIRNKRERCCLCPLSKGAMKQTTDGRWAHLFCALFVPEVFYLNAKEREGIECTKVPTWRWQMQCGLCKQNGGACIQCTEVGCTATFHVSCGLDHDLAIQYRQPNSSNLGRTPGMVIAFCSLHTPQWRAAAERSRCKIVPRFS